MEVNVVLICLVAFGASVLTFFSGFGLGTLLMAIMVIYFPVEEAIVMTAIVHFGNNIFKAGLIGRHIQWKAALWFGIPAIVASAIGAVMLVRLASLNQPFLYSVGEIEFSTSLIQVIIGILLILFAIWEFYPIKKNIKIETRTLAFGGLLSGFFGGLSGHQGALRSAFLIRYDLIKEAFIATGIAISLGIDLTRIGVYLLNPEQLLTSHTRILIFAMLAAFLGAVVGRRALKKIKIRMVQIIVSIGLLLLGVSLIAGWVGA